jgi:hypothetical protein
MAHVRSSSLLYLSSIATLGDHFEPFNRLGAPAFRKNPDFTVLALWHHY